MLHQYKGHHAAARAVTALSLRAKITVLAAAVGPGILGLFAGAASAGSHRSRRDS
jgi:hypothetical protein